MGNRTASVLAVLWVATACHSGDTGRNGGERLADVVHQYRNEVTMTELSSILVITEEGCPACNKSLALMVENYLEDTTALVWVSATGSMVDISPFRSMPDRVVWDYGDSLQSLGIIQGSGAIFLKEGRIDTVIQLEARNLKNALVAVEDRMEVRAK